MCDQGVRVAMFARLSKNFEGQIQEPDVLLAWEISAD
jgi:hypothetical protein